MITTLKSTSPLVLLTLGLAGLATGCSQTSSLSSGYGGAISPSSKLAVSSREPDSYALALSDQARNNSYASRGALQTIDYASAYSARNDGGILVPAFDYTKMNSRYLRQEVHYYGGEAPGTIVVDAKRKLLYLVQPNKKAMRYGIAVGKEGFGWTGNSVLQWKQKWPTWTPPKEMIDRNPKLAKYADGLKGSPENPLGARAMYLYKDGRDTLYRIHGTTKPYSIGKAASSGCFRMINQDVIDLYSRVGRKNVVQVRTAVSERVARVEPYTNR